MPGEPPEDPAVGQYLAGTLWFCWVGCGRLAEGRHWLGRALELPGEPSEARAKVMWVYGYVALLQGDSTTVSMQNALRRLLSTTTAGNIPMLSNLGIGVSKAGDGSIALDSTKFSAALAKSPADVQTFFTNATGNDATQGFGLKLKGLMDTLLGTGGAIASKTASLDKQKKANSSDQDAMNSRLAATEARIRAQYTALDTKVASLNVLSTYITNQIAQWNKSTS